ncbi:hypothetical protein BHE74_00007886 [Ensete ventricosum]|nr:hypothetical protein BHE74_00007886 [Ensete ventricosum]
MTCFASLSARSGPSEFANCTKPKPLPLPVSRFLITTTSLTSPYLSKCSVSVSSLVSDEMPPTNSLPHSHADAAKEVPEVSVDDDSGSISCPLLCSACACSLALCCF